LVVVDYVSKWAEAIPCRKASTEEAIQVIKTVIFHRYGIPKILMSDGGSHFIGKDFKRCLSKMGIEHRVSTTDHPQTNGQEETSNKKLKGILMKTVTKGGKDWSKKLNGALWAYRTAHKRPIKEMNLAIDAARIKRRIQISELEELTSKAHHNTSIYKERIKRWYDKRLHKGEGDMVLLYNSQYKVFNKGKQQRKWDGSYVVHSVSPSGAVTIMDAKGDQYVVNGQQLKVFLEPDIVPIKYIDIYTLDGDLDHQD
jgi:cell division protein FtsI/penicillin-binding protein 2